MFAGVSVSLLATFTMRQHYSPQPDLQLIPIEKIRLPLKSRDELPPILAGWQWLWMPAVPQGRGLRLARSRHPRRLAGHRPHGHGSLANPRARRRAAGVGRRLGSPSPVSPRYRFGSFATASSMSFTVSIVPTFLVGKSNRVNAGVCPANPPCAARQVRLSPTRHGHSTTQSWRRC